MGNQEAGQTPLAATGCCCTCPIWMGEHTPPGPDCGAYLGLAMHTKAGPAAAVMEGVDLLPAGQREILRAWA